LLLNACVISSNDETEYPFRTLFGTLSYFQNCYLVRKHKHKEDIPMRKLILSLAALSVMAVAAPLAANADPVVIVGHHHHWSHRHDHGKTVIIKHDHD
jgi:hypothetical protein